MGTGPPSFSPWYGEYHLQVSIRYLSFLQVPQSNLIHNPPSSYLKPLFLQPCVLWKKVVSCVFGNLTGNVHWKTREGLWEKREIPLFRRVRYSFLTVPNTVSNTIYTFHLHSIPLIPVSDTSVSQDPNLWSKSELSTECNSKLEKPRVERQTFHPYCYVESVQRHS